MVLIFGCLALVASAAGATDIHVVSSGGFAAALKALAPVRTGNGRQARSRPGAVDG
jgi:hypothetical protein